MYTLHPLNKIASAIALIAGTFLAGNVAAVPYTQCPGDETIPSLLGPVPGHDAVPDPASLDFDPNVRCMHLSSGDGFGRMGDGDEIYLFGFADLTGKDDLNTMSDGYLASALPAPLIELEEGQEFYLTLSNVGMAARPDLADPHTVHFHGFPNASAMFDGLPDASVSINMGSSFTYYYNLVDPGTFMYHCHVEAAEHMQMGMMGNLYVNAAQNNVLTGTVLGTHVHNDTPALGPHEYAYNDGDGTTYYHVDYPIQMGSMDKLFHDEHQAVQPIPFADMFDTYPMLNGRGYPDTKVIGALPVPTQNGGIASQVEDSLITATAGQRILLRLSNLNITNFYTIRTLGLDMEVVGTGARQLRGPDPDGTGPLVGVNNEYTTNSVTLGGGEAMDIIIDTAGTSPGDRYFLYTTNLNYLSNHDEDYGGMMTEIVIN